MELVVTALGSIRLELWLSELCVRIIERNFKNPDDRPFPRSIKSESVGVPQRPPLCQPFTKPGNPMYGSSEEPVASKIPQTGITRQFPQCQNSGLTIHFVSPLQYVFEREKENRNS